MRTRLLAAIAAGALVVAGTLLLVAYVRGVEERVRAGEELVEVLVVQQVVEAGTPAEALADVVAPTPIARRNVADSAVRTIEAFTSSLAGRVTDAVLFPGEQVLETRLVDPEDTDADVVDVPPRLHEVTVALDAQRTVGGTLAPGDLVAAYVSLAEGPGEAKEGATHLVLHKLLVTQVQFEPDAGAGVDAVWPAGQILVTVAVDAGEAERLVFG
ncbi:MAG: RcpC/CpaB family pilus assembly protein, partial [Nitriliruptoraceae bacterium]